MLHFKTFLMYQFKIFIGTLIIKLFIDWRSHSLPNLITAIEKQMKFELLLIRNALFSLSNELELTPDVQHYIIPATLWRKWAQPVRDRALKDFLSGNAPFQTVFEVSSDGTTFFPKKFSKMACKPGTVQRHRFKYASAKIRKLSSIEYI